MLILILNKTNEAASVLSVRKFKYQVPNENPSEKLKNNINFVSVS